MERLGDAGGGGTPADHDRLRLPVSQREFTESAKSTRPPGTWTGAPDAAGALRVVSVDSLELDDEPRRRDSGRGWGLAGNRQGKPIVATKIPKSGYLAEYMQETDPDAGASLLPLPAGPRCAEIGDTPVTYCYCGAGYYKGIWEEILQQPVQVEVLESVLQGGDVCKIAVYLPVETPSSSPALTGRIGSTFRILRPPEIWPACVPRVSQAKARARGTTC